MIRDFSQEAKNTLYDHIDSVSPTGVFEYIWDSLDDHNMISLGIASDISGYLNDIDRYHELVLDKKNTSKETVDRIFTDVQSVDAKFANYLRDICEGITSRTNFVKQMKDTISIKEQLGFSVATASLSSQIIKEQEKDMEILVSAYKNKIITEFSDEQKQKMENFVVAQSERLGQDIARDGEDEKRQSQWLLVDVYRALDAKTSMKFDTLLNSGNEPLEDFDKNNIMYIAYTADEPYRTLFLETLGTYTLGDVTLKEGSFYTTDGALDRSPYAVGNTVNFNPTTSFYSSLKGPYNGFFHECGHAIDYQLGKGGFYSVQYMDGTNFDVICEDVYTRIEEEIRSYCEAHRDDVTEEQEDILCENIISYIKDIGYGTYELTTEENDVFEAIHKEFEEQLIKNEQVDYLTEEGEKKSVTEWIRSGISDIYGGVTNNIIVGAGKHENFDAKDLDGDGNKKENIYWYNLQPPYEHTGNQEMEMWGHYFSFGITGNEEAVNDMRVYLENAMERYDSMAEDMVEKLGE